VTPRGQALQAIIDELWIAPDNAKWTPKTDVVSLSDVREWFKSEDIEILGLAQHLIHNGRFRIEPPLSLTEYKDFIKLYFERCLREDPDGDWSDSRYSAAWDMVNIFTSLWRDKSVSRDVLKELKNWLAQLYKDDEKVRTCLVTAPFEHLFERKDIRKFFSDWTKDAVLSIAYKEACEWYLGGGKTPLGKPPFVPRGRSR
jgi:hypothetical protein